MRVEFSGSGAVRVCARRDGDGRGRRAATPRRRRRRRRRGGADVYFVYLLFRRLAPRPAAGGAQAARSAPPRVVRGRPPLPRDAARAIERGSTEQRKSPTFAYAHTRTPTHTKSLNSNSYTHVVSNLEHGRLHQRVRVRCSNCTASVHEHPRRAGISGLRVNPSRRLASRQP